MRSVDKGTSPKIYKKHRNALPDLEERIGEFCSYCEGNINTRKAREVEHIIPQSQRPDLALEWENFLLTCDVCNRKKSAINCDRANFLWPDEDNTFFVFTYEMNLGEIRISDRITDHRIRIWAQNTINLFQLDRKLSKGLTPNQVSWLSKRNEAIGLIRKYLGQWNNNEITADTISDFAKLTGYYSLWMLHFESHPEVIEAIKSKFPGTYEPRFDENNNPIKREGGRF